MHGEWQGVVTDMMAENVSIQNDCFLFFIYYGIFPNYLMYLSRQSWSSLTSFVSP